VLEELFQLHFERVVRVVRVHMNAALRSRMESVDLVQDTFAAALRGCDALGAVEPASATRWLAAIARNQVRDASKRALALRRDASREEPFDAEARSRHASATAPPAALVERRELAALVRCCVGRLAGDRRRVVLMRDYEGASWHSIARALGRSTGAVQMLHARACSELQHRLRSVGVRGLG